MKKKISALLVILILAVSLVSAGCGEDNAAAQPDVKVTSASSKAVQADSAEKASPAAQSGDAASSKSTAEAAPASSGGSTAETAQASSGNSSGETAQASSGNSSGEASQASSGDSSAEAAQASSGDSSAEPAQQPSAETEETSAAGSGQGNGETEETSAAGSGQGSGGSADEDALTVSEDGEYTDKEHVALYIHEFGHLPSNYVTKNKAMDAGWNNREGNLNKVLPGKSIGGDKFGNYEGRLPKANGRKYYECDIDFNPDGQTSRPVYRNEKRIIYSNDGLVFYTEDHYETFEQLY